MPIISKMWNQHFSRRITNIYKWLVDTFVTILIQVSSVNGDDVSIASQRQRQPGRPVEALVAFLERLLACCCCIALLRPGTVAAVCWHEEGEEEDEPDRGAEDENRVEVDRQVAVREEESIELIQKRTVFSCSFDGWWNIRIVTHRGASSSETGKVCPHSLVGLLASNCLAGTLTQEARRSTGR